MLSLIVATIITGSLQQAAADTLTLDYCYTRVENHYPLARKLELQEDITNLNRKITNTASYPQLNFGITATYQSEVTEFDVPAGGSSIGPELSKDQYKATMDVTQSIYNGGKVKLSKKLEEARGEQQNKSVHVELHRLKEQVNHIYFGILLAKQQQKIIGSLTENLRAQIISLQSKVENGVMLPSQKYILEAELIKVKQDSTSIRANLKSGYNVLGQLIGEEVELDVPLKMPESKGTRAYNSIERLRPEFDVFESNRRILEYQKGLAQTNKIPTLSAFGTAAYGRPGLNFFENNLHNYYIVGLKLQWNFWSFQNSGMQQEVYNLRQKSITKEEQAFERQLQASLGEIMEEINALEDHILRDKEILELREQVVKTVSSQLKNGTATATEYVTELNKATQALLSMKIHEIELMQAKINYQTTLGAN